MARKASRPTVLPLEDRAVPATIAGSVFADINADGVQDAGESGLTQITVQLDAGANGTIDAVTFSDATGGYRFTGIADGTNTVIVIPPAGTTAVGPTTRVAIVAGDADVATPAIGLTPNGKVRGEVFADLNGNGKRDSGEAGLSGVTVMIDTGGNGGADYSVVTASDGTYSVEAVTDGTHKVIVVPPVNYLPVSNNPQSAAVLSGSEVVNTFALRPATAISGRVSLFALHGNVPATTLGVEIDYQNDGKVDAKTTTATDGSYLFANVPNGTHTIKVIVPPGSTVYSSTGNNSQLITVAGNATSDVNFGVSFPGSVTGGLFLDVNGNTKRDANENGITVGSFLVDLNNSGTLIDVTAKATGNGSFLVTGIPDGDHALVMNPGGGYAGTGTMRIPFTITNGSQATLAEVGVRGVSGSTLTVGGGQAGAAITYTFSPGANGALTATPGRTMGVPSASGTRVTTADFNGDGIEDTITATGPGTRATVRVFDGKSGGELVAGGIQVFEGSFSGGINLAAGDFNHDGKADIVISADTGGGPRVQILNAAQFQAGANPGLGKVLADFLGIEDAKFRGGTRVAAGDINGDGTPDLVVAAGQGGGPRVALFDGTSLTVATRPTRLVGDFFVYESTLRNGATVAVGDVNGDGLADLVAGAGPGGAPRVTVFSGAGVIAGQGDLSPRIADFFVTNDLATRNGTRITVKDIDRDGMGDLIATNGVRAYAYTATNISAFYVNPIPGQTPAIAAELFPFGSNTSALYVG